MRRRRSAKTDGGADGAREPERAGQLHRHGGGAGQAAGDGARGRERQPRGRLVRRRSAGGLLQGAAGRRGVGQVNHARQLVGSTASAAPMPSSSAADDQEPPRLWRHAGRLRGGCRPIQEMKARGLRVTFYPFILMDVPPGNTLPNPYSDNAAGTGQPAFPLAGADHLFPRLRGSPERWTRPPRRLSQVAALFGSATPANFSVSGQSVSWTGPSGDWGLRRMVLHYAHLCAAAGGVDAFLIGTEDAGADDHPLGRGHLSGGAGVSGSARGCAVDFSGRGSRSAMPPTWSEYFGHQPGDGSGDVFFHLDPLWADPEIDFVADRQLHAAVGLARRVRACGRGRRAGPRSTTGAISKRTSRAAKARLVLCQRGGSLGAGAHLDHRRRRQQALGLPLQGSARLVVEPALRPSRWRGERHADRVGAAVQADLVHRARLPGHRPGQPHQPNVFFDPKSSESFTPHFSRGWRDDAIQRAYLGGDLSLVGHPGKQSGVLGLRCPHGASARNAPPGPGTRGPIRSFRR